MLLTLAGSVLCPRKSADAAWAEFMSTLVDQVRVSPSGSAQHLPESGLSLAGASHGQELPPEKMEALILAAGRRPQQRTCIYEQPPAGQREKSFFAGPLAPLVMN